MFALGPTNGTLACSIKAKVAWLSGIRKATVSKPPVTVLENVSLGTLKIKVNGPGQKADTNFVATSGKVATYFLTISTLFT